MNDMGNTLSAPQRNNYFYGKLMDVFHFQMEQKYADGKRRLLNRLSLGEGVLCGLEVTVQNNQLWISPGVAIDAWGREIVVPTATSVDPWQLTDPSGEPTTLLPQTAPAQVYLSLVYRECAADFMPVLVTDCNTQAQCAPGTIVESFRFVVQQETPSTVPDPNSGACSALSGTSASQRRQLLSRALAGSCPNPSGTGSVTLASIQLNSDGNNGTVGAIDSWTYRPAVYSNAQLLDLILCLADRIEKCCGGSPYYYAYGGLHAIGAHLI